MDPNVYATPEDMTGSYGQALIDVLGVSTEEEALEAPALLEALAAANDAADTHLRGRYTLPLADVPENLSDAVMAIAYLKLLRKLRDTHVNDDDRAASKEGYDYLMRLASGSISLTFPTPDVTLESVLPVAVELGSLVPDADREGMAAQSWFRDW